MIDAPKVIFDAHHFNFESNGQDYSKTHYFAIAPSLYNANSKTNLPLLYRLSVCREIGNPEHFSFSTYAIAGGYADGFYFLSRLDNNVATYAHLDRTAKSHKRYKPTYSERCTKAQKLIFRTFTCLILRPRTII